MTLDEGYIKYASNWIPGAAPDLAATAELEMWRQPLYMAGLIGHYAETGIGFGNISVRSQEPRQFIISGTQTGHLPTTNAAHYALVTDYDIEENWVSSLGPIEASSESLTHAAIYELDTTIGAVVHIHSRALWTALLHQLPTTHPDISYGTPEMACEFARLFLETNFASTGIAIMAGHVDGIVSIGSSLREAATRVLELDANSI